MFTAVIYFVFGENCLLLLWQFDCKVKRTVPIRFECRNSFFDGKNVCLYQNVIKIDDGIIIAVAGKSLCG